MFNWLAKKNKIDPTLILGVWLGETFYESDKTRVMFQSNYEADGNKTVHFKLRYRDGSNSQDSKIGTWFLSDNILTDRLKIVGYDHVDQSSYTVLSTTKDVFKYKSHHDGRVYVLRRFDKKQAAKWDKFLT